MAPFRSLTPGMAKPFTPFSVVMLAVFAALLVCLWAAQSCLVVHVDNYFISMVANGYYGQDAYCLFINPVLSQILFLLASVNPAVDWFLLLSQLLSFFGLVFLAYCALRCGTPAPRAAVVLLAMVYVTAHAQLFNCNFTISSAFFAAVGWVSLSLYVRSSPVQESGFRGVALGCALLFYGASIMFRWECALLSVPFAIVELLPLSVRAGRMAIDEPAVMALKRSFLGMLALTALAVALSAAMFCLKCSPAYSEADEYNDARSSIVDYPAKRWEEVSGDLPWMTENDYRLVHAWFFADTELFSTTHMEEIAQYSRANSNSIDSPSALVDMVLFGLAGSSGYLIAICVFGLYALRLGGGTVRAKLIISALIASGALFYYAYVGRLPERVVLAVLFNMLIATGIGYCSVGGKLIRTKCRFGADAVLCAVVVFALVCAVPQVVSRYQSQIVGRFCDDGVEIVDPGDDPILFWDSSAYINRYRFAGCMPTKEYISRNIPTGTWLYGQPYFEAFLAERGVANPAEALLERGDSFFVSRDPSLVLGLLRERYSPYAQVRQVGLADDVPVWKFYLGAEEGQVSK